MTPRHTNSEVMNMQQVMEAGRMLGEEMNTPTRVEWG